MKQFAGRLGNRLWRFLDQQGSQHDRQRPVLTRQDLKIGQPGIRLYEFPEHADTVTYRVISGKQQLPDELTGSAGIQNMMPFVLEIEDGRLLGRHAVALTANGSIVLESAAANPSYIALSSFSRIHFPQHPAMLWQQLTDELHFDAVASIVNLFSNGYYHWMLEGLPRLHSLLLLQQQTGIRPRLLIDPDPPNWVRESLEILGYRSNDYQVWDRTRARARKLYIPWMADRSGQPSPTACSYVSETLRQAAGHRTFDTPYIYVSRTDAKKRRVRNEDEVLNVLERYGFVRYETGKMPLLDQVALFAQAKIVVGPHGAGFANLIHSQQAAMLEFFEPTYVNACSYRLATSLGHRYRVLMAESRGADMQVDTALLESTLVDLLP